jgi:hypothetical protein
MGRYFAHRGGTAYSVGRLCRGLVEDLEGDLDLAGGAGGAVDDAEAWAEDDVGGEGGVDDVEGVEDLEAGVENDAFGLFGEADGGVFDE